MKRSRGKKREGMLVILVIFAAALLCATANAETTKPVVTRATVTRTTNTTTPAPGSTFEVTLNLTGTGLQIGGVVETIPDGFAFVRTTHPENQTYTAGQKVVFGVVNETVIKYEVQAPSSEGAGATTGIFNGEWYNALTKAKGEIGSTSVSVRAGLGAAETPTPTSTPALSPPALVPGFEAVFAVTGLFTVAAVLLVFVQLKKKGGEARGRE